MLKPNVSQVFTINGNGLLLSSWLARLFPRSRFDWRQNPGCMVFTSGLPVTRSRKPGLLLPL